MLVCSIKALLHYSLPPRRAWLYTQLAPIDSWPWMAHRYKWKRILRRPRWLFGCIFVSHSPLQPITNITSTPHTALSLLEQWEDGSYDQQCSCVLLIVTTNKAVETLGCSINARGCSELWSICWPISGKKLLFFNSVTITFISLCLTRQIRDSCVCVRVCLWLSSL